MTESLGLVFMLFIFFLPGIICYVLNSGNRKRKEERAEAMRRRNREGK